MPEAPVTPDPEWAWLCRPIGSEQPAGPNLEYETAYAVLRLRLQAQPEVQYGSFIHQQAIRDWAEVQAACVDLLRRSRDITLLIWWLRCRVHLAGARGLAQGLECLLQALVAFNATLHPCAGVDEPDPEQAVALRANALAALADPDGLLGDVRALQIEQPPSPGDADAAEVFQALSNASEALAGIEAWARRELAASVPDLSPLMRFLQRCLDHWRPWQGAFAEENPGPSEDAGPKLDDLAKAQSAVPCPVLQPSAPAPITAAASRADAAPRPAALDHVDPDDWGRQARAHRQAALDAIVRARRWFEAFEPSSPIGPLLRRAESWVGQSYTQLARALPTDWLRDETKGP